MLNPNSEQLIAEAAYAHLRKFRTKREMAEIIHKLLADTQLIGLTQNVVIRMAMIYSAEEGH